VRPFEEVDGFGVGLDARAPRCLPYYHIRNITYVVSTRPYISFSSKCRP